ncbi:MAG: MlaD family protein [Planctomycetota bacterium]
MNSAKDTVLGLLFFAALIALGVLTIVLRDVSFFESKHEYVVYFHEVNGLREGDAVLVYGTKFGKVSHIEVTESTKPEERVRVVLSLNREVTFREGYKVYIRDSSFLGGKLVEIQVGERDARLVESRTLAGTALAEPLRALQLLIEDNRDKVSQAIGNFADLVTYIASGRGSLGRFLREETAYDGVIRILEGLQGVVGGLESQGQGTLARLIHDPALAEDVALMAASGRQLLQAVDRGEGSLGKLVRDDTLYQELSAAAGAARQVLERIERGEGLVGQLTSPQSDQLFEDLLVLVADLRATVSGLREGRGLAGALLTNDELAVNLEGLLADARKVASDLAEITTHLRQGGGALGLVLYDGETRERLASLVKQLAGVVEDAREAAPVSSFASFLFGTW